jgi:hypothetical protein
MMQGHLASAELLVLDNLGTQLQCFPVLKHDRYAKITGTNHSESVQQEVNAKRVPLQ